jgi:hypothetical protein
MCGRISKNDKEREGGFINGYVGKCQRMRNNRDKGKGRRKWE